MPSDWVDVVQMVLSAVVGWLVEWLRQRRKAAGGARKPLVRALLLGLVIAGGTESCQVTRCVKGCFRAPPAEPPAAAEPAPSPAPAAPGGS